MSDPTLKDCINYMKSQLKQMEKYPRSYEYNIPYYRQTIMYLEELSEFKFDKTDDRPQGEWIHAEEYDYLDENGVEHFHIKCPNCSFLHDCFDCHTAQYNFCPNCGADMREEGDSDA